VSELLNLPVLYIELGPTRYPFHETLYFDPKGSGGSASIRDISIDCLKKKNIYGSRVWSHFFRSQLIKNYDARTYKIEEQHLSASSTQQMKNYLKNGEYVFIPLQLADDLSLLVHSNYESPKSFLEDIVPTILANGFKIILKGHPAASRSEFTQQAEISALKLATKLSPDVHILSQATNPIEMAQFVKNAFRVITVNSSVGFESLMFGSRVKLMGNAVYDLHQILSNKSIFEPGISDHFHDKFTEAQLASYLCEHYFIPVVDILNSKVLCHIFNFAISQFQHKTSNLNLYWQQWTSSVKVDKMSLLCGKYDEGFRAR
jgi:capsular polysaccharide export protein